MSEEFKTKWHQFGRVWETGQLEVMDEVFTPNVDYHLPPLPDMNLESLKEFIAGFSGGCWNRSWVVGQL